MSVRSLAVLEFWTGILFRPTPLLVFIITLWIFRSMHLKFAPTKSLEKAKTPFFPVILEISIDLLPSFLILQPLYSLR